MGNGALCAGRGDRDAVTVLQANGNVLSYYNRVRVVDLILDFPNHFVCHSSSLVLMQQGRILPLHTILVPGEVYFLLPIPGREAKPNGDDSDTSSLLHIEPPRRAVNRTGSMKFVISTEQFSKILSGSIKEGSTVSRRRTHRRTSARRKPATGWRPALSSIEEVTANWRQVS